MKNMIGISSNSGLKANNYDNVSPAANQAKIVENVNAPVDTSVAANASGNNTSFVQNVLQSLQNLGLDTSNVNANSNGASTVDNTSSSNANAALQVFVQDLYQALTQSSNPQTSSVDNSNSSNATDVPPALNDTTTPTIISGGTNFKYTVDLSQANLGDNLANVEANVKTALDNIGQYISSNAVFNLKILTTNVNSDMLAETNSSLMTTNNQNGANVDTTFIADSISGTNSYPNTPDATLYINLAKVGELSFSGSPPPDKFDLTSILTHEILHGLAFAGGSASGSSTLKTSYDSLITTQNNAPVFVGRHAETVNGGNPVPLSPADAGQGSAYYHVTIPNDLMAASIKKGEVKGISALDVAMLEDMGLTVTGASPNNAPQLQNAYSSNPSANLQNLINSLGSNNAQNSALQTDFSNLVQSLDSSSSASLQDFLGQLAINVGNSDTLQNGSGSLFSATA